MAKKRAVKGVPPVVAAEKPVEKILDPEFASSGSQFGERTVDERVSEVFSAPEPVDAPVGDSEVESFLADARAAQGVYSAGNAVSPDVLKALVNRAVALLSRG